MKESRDRFPLQRSGVEDDGLRILGGGTSDRELTSDSAVVEDFHEAIPMGDAP